MGTAYAFALFADVLHACDARWWDTYGAEAKEAFHGEKWTCDPYCAARHDLHVMHSAEAAGLSLNPNKINTGGNSGYQAVGLAFAWGAAKIVLLGYDMQRTSGKGHCHGEHPEHLPRDSPFPEFARRFIALGADLRTQGVRVINATRETALSCFERMPIEEALQ